LYRCCNCNTPSRTWIRGKELLAPDIKDWDIKISQSFLLYIVFDLSSFTLFRTLTNLNGLKKLNINELTGGFCFLFLFFKNPIKNYYAILF